MAEAALVLSALAVLVALAALFTVRDVRRGAPDPLDRPTDRRPSTVRERAAAWPFESKR
ncbi:MAG: hypothetical protein JWP11_3672 [Frankiales bacterium]|nr:hypothetical protein [Frankiales bacterium]